MQRIEESIQRRNQFLLPDAAAKMGFVIPTEGRNLLLAARMAMSKAPTESAHSLVAELPQAQAEQQHIKRHQHDQHDNSGEVRELRYQCPAKSFTRVHQ